MHNADSSRAVEQRRAAVRTHKRLAADVVTRGLCGVLIGAAPTLVGWRVDVELLIWVGLVVMGLGILVATAARAVQEVAEIVLASMPAPELLS